MTAILRPDPPVSTPWRPAGRRQRARAIASICAALLWIFIGTGAAANEDAPDVLPGSDTRIRPEWRDAVHEDSAWANRLALSGSAYLRQHADNPIDWRPWDDEALALARSQNRLLFVSVGYASCHWCHVMERQSFSDVAVARALNGSFVALKVDRETRPELDAWASSVAEALTGERGWPTTLVLLPDLTPVFAGHYLDRDATLTLLRRLQDEWRDTPEQVRQRAALAALALPAADDGAAPGEFDPESLAVAAQRHLLAAADAEFGGFGAAEKFPDEARLAFLLARYVDTGDSALGEALQRQLDAVMTGGLSDPVFGGVFRYTTDRAMRRPHFEKMLFNQAQVITLFADAAWWLQRPDYLRFAQTVRAFTEQTLRLPDGRFASAVDAEHAGVEGGYYRWPLAALPTLPPTVRTETMDDGHAYLTGFDPGTATWRDPLITQRDESPRVTANAVTAWNALMIEADLALGDTAAAADTAEALWASAWRRGRLERVDGQPGFIDDHALLSHALWQLHAATLEPRWRERARRLDEALLARFYREGRLHLAADRNAPAVPVSLARDDESPPALPAALRVFAHHADDPRFGAVRKRLLAGALAEAVDRPQDFTSLLLSLAPLPDSRVIFASGHGAARLVRGNSEIDSRLEVLMEEGWHVNAATVPKGGLVPTQLTVPVGAIDVRYPDGVPLDADFSDEMLLVYGGRFRIPHRRTGVEHPARLDIRWQACSDRICLLPEGTTLVNRH